MKTEEIVRLAARLRTWPREMPLTSHQAAEAADALDAQAAEIASMRKAFKTVFPAKDGFTEAFDDLVYLGLLVEVPSDEAFREWWGDEPTMWVWRWHPLATPSEPTP